MKLENILNEDLSPRVSFRDLTPVQVSCLVRLSKGLISHETASARELEVLDSLCDLGLLDEYYELTPHGELSARLGKKLGSMDRREAARRDSKLGRRHLGRRRYVDIAADIPDEDVIGDVGKFTDKWSEVREYD